MRIMEQAARVSREDVEPQGEAVTAVASPEPSAVTEPSVAPEPSHSVEDAVASPVDTVAASDVQVDAAASTPAEPAEPVVESSKAVDEDENVVRPNFGQAGAGVDEVDPVAEAITSAMGAGSASPDAAKSGDAGDPVDADAEKDKEVDPLAARKMSYHEALNHLDMTKARRGHVDIDERITQYVKTGKRGALDVPSPKGMVKLATLEERDKLDPVMVHANEVVKDGPQSRDVSIHAALEQIKSRGDRDRKPIASLTKGPAKAEGPDVVAAAESKRTGSER
jgi:hypothetical protein